MQFGQVEREGLDAELWSLWQRNQSPDYLHLSMRQGCESYTRWQWQTQQTQKSDPDSIRSSSYVRWLTRLLGWVRR